MINSSQVLINTWIFKELIFYKATVSNIPSALFIPHKQLEHKHILSVGGPQSPVWSSLPHRRGGQIVCKSYERGHR